MLIDNLLVLDPSGTAVTSTAASTNTIDLLAIRDIGIGAYDDLEVVTLVNTAFTAAGAATLQVQLQTSSDNSTWVTLIQSDTIAKATLVAGYEAAKWTLPEGIKRYIRLNYVVATGPMTAGALQSAIILDHQANPAYAAGFSTQYI